MDHVEKAGEEFFNFELLKEGKTKKIWGHADIERVLIENTDRLTAYNGLEEVRIDGKGWYATQISNNCFRYLQRQGIANHFIWPYEKQGFDHVFWAHKLSMLPVEFVVRNQPYGSYLERFPDAPYVDTFPEPIVEYFEKNDDLGDPWLIVDHEREIVRRYMPNCPQSKDSLIDEQPFSALGHLMLDQWDQATSLVYAAALALKKAWEHCDATLVDIKFECGVRCDNRVVIGDSIDADCWRLWRDDDPTDPLDRQLFKNNRHTAEILEAQRFILLQTMQWLPTSGQ